MNQHNPDDRLPPLPPEGPAGPRRHRSKTAKPATGRRRGTLVHQAEFDTYAIWQALPAIVRGQPESTLRALGINDPVTIDLLGIRTQEEFATRFKVNRCTLTEWNGRADLARRIDKARTTWARRLTSNTYMAVYRGLLKEGDASRFKVWMQVVEGWVEKTRNEHSGPGGADLFQNLSQVSDDELNRRIADITKRITRRAG